MEATEADKVDNVRKYESEDLIMEEFEAEEGGCLTQDNIEDL